MRHRAKLRFIRLWGHQLIPRTQTLSMVRIWKRVDWWKTATDHPQAKASAYHNTGTCTTPYWHCIVAYTNITPQGKAEAEKACALKWPLMDSNMWDATTCEMCGEGAPLPYSDCRTRSSVPSWPHGKCGTGEPTFRIVKTPSVDRGDEHVTGTYHRPIEP